MRRFALIVLASACFSPFASPARPASPATVPTVHFTIFRFNADTQQFVGLYEFNQPYRKSLADPGWAQSTDLFWAYAPPSDFGEVDVKSRITGQLILKATVVWMGMGTFDYPPSSMMSTTLLHGFTNPAPEAVIDPGIPSATDVNAAWALVGDTDAVARLAAYGRYEVYAWRHHYGDGGSPPNPEIFIVAASHPLAPTDMGILELAWPRTLVTRGMSVTPEVAVHNFGDASTDLKVRLTASGEPQPYPQPIGALPADASRTVFMPALLIADNSTHTLSCDLRTNGGGTWSDAFPDNDIAQRIIRVTDQPVFRLAATIPHDGVPCDFDGDGDTDIVAFEQYLQLYRNNGSGGFSNITGLSTVPARLWPRYAICGDFNRDSHPDLFVSVWAQKGMMLAGDGTGAFSDVTTAWGLNLFTTYSDMLAVDKDNDGDLDILIAVQGQEYVLENDGTGHFTNVAASSGLADSWQTERMAAGDLNGDGYPDIALANWGHDANVFVNDGDGTFTRLNRSWNLTYERDVAIFDFDGDGDNDIFFLHEIYGPSRLYRNDGNLVFSEMAAPADGFPRDISVDAGDFNHDGRGDLVFTSGTLLMSTGSALEDTTALLIDQTQARMAMGDDVYFADLDHDGDLDVYAGYRQYLNQGLRPVATGPDKPIAVASMLEQNFPNPFNPTTTIRYRVTTSGHVMLAIYNVAGQRVRTLVDDSIRASTATHEAVWDGLDNRGASVASGIYLYRLTAPGFSQSRKLVLLK